MSEKLKSNPKRYVITGVAGTDKHTFNPNTRYYTLQVVGPTINALPSGNVRYAFASTVNLATDAGDGYATLIAGGAHNSPEKFIKSDSITAVWFTGTVGDVVEIHEFIGGVGRV